MTSFKTYAGNDEIIIKEVDKGKAKFKEIIKYETLYNLSNTEWISYQILKHYAK